MWRDRFLEVRVLPLPPFAINKKHLFRPRSGRALCRPRSLPNRNMTGALVFWATASLENKTSGFRYKDEPAANMQGRLFSRDAQVLGVSA